MSERAERLQARINAALQETREETPASRFSPYLQDSGGVVASMMEAARDGGVEAALDLFDRLRASEDLGLLRHALMRFLVEHPAAGKLGLRIPSLIERAPWMAAPSNRKR